MWFAQQGIRVISIFQNREIGDRPNLKPSWTPFVPDLGVKYTRRQMKLQLRGQRWLITRNFPLQCWPEFSPQSVGTLFSALKTLKLSVAHLLCLFGWAIKNSRKSSLDMNK